MGNYRISIIANGSRWVAGRHHRWILFLSFFPLSSPNVSIPYLCQIEICSEFGIMVLGADSTKLPCFAGEYWESAFFLYLYKQLY